MSKKINGKFVELENSIADEYFSYSDIYNNQLLKTKGWLSKIFIIKIENTCFLIKGFYYSNPMYCIPFDENNLYEDIKTSNVAIGNIIYKNKLTKTIKKKLVKTEKPKIWIKAFGQVHKDMKESENWKISENWNFIFTLIEQCSYEDQKKLPNWLYSEFISWTLKS